MLVTLVKLVIYDRADVAPFGARIYSLGDTIIG